MNIGNEDRSHAVHTAGVAFVCAIGCERPTLRGVRRSGKFRSKGFAHATILRNPCDMVA
jgi:hypothetical protein